MALRAVAYDGDFLSFERVYVSVFFVKASWHLVSLKIRQPLLYSRGSVKTSDLGYGRGRYRGLQPEFFRLERHGDGAGAGYVDFAIAAHDLDEFVEFFGLARGFDGEAFGGRIDHSAMEDFRFLEDGGPAVLHAAHSHQNHLANHGRRFGHIGGLQYVDQFVDLLDDLGADAVFHINHDG